MTNTDSERKARVVVGLDGSVGSLRALSWAAGEARARDAILEVVAAWTYPTPVLLIPVAPDPPTVKTLRTEARGMIDRALEKVTEHVAGLDIEPRVLEGNAPQVLLERGKEADVLVVGSRGFGGFRGLLLGSVSQQCVQHATCPVVVVPSPDDD
jgi:nucleotide-binding universal stress UspA family protein